MPSNGWQWKNESNTGARGEKYRALRVLLYSKENYGNDEDFKQGRR